MLKRKEPVLIVEDDPAILLRHKMILSKQFPNILTAENGEEAWEIFDSTSVLPLLVTDIDMPKKNGLWLIEKVLKSDRCTQIIIISGLTKNSVSIFSAYEHISYLPKPVESMYLTLAAVTAYSFFPKAVWLSKLEKRIKEQADDNELLKIIHKNPFS
jgi:DNA-binding NtrC family response regulator